MKTASNRLAVLLSEPFEAVRREFERDVNRAFAVSHGGFGAMSRVEDPDHLAFEFDLPGVVSENLELTVEDGSLKLKIERPAPTVEEGRKVYDERRYGTFERVLPLPDGVDTQSVEASLEDGVLRVSLAWKPETQPQKIAINHVTSGGKNA